MIGDMKYKILTALAGICTLITSCGESEDGNAESATSNSSIPTVEVVYPGYESFVSNIAIAGLAKANQSVEVFGMEGGVVSTLSADIGDLVSKNQVLCQLRNPELKRLAESLSAQHDAKKKIYDRLKSTHEQTPSITPLQEVEEANAAWLSAEAEMNAANERLEFLKVKAPFAGVVSQRFVDEGSLVQSGLSGSETPLFEVQQYNPVRVTIPLPETDASAIKPGTMCEVNFPQLPGESFEVPVSRVAGALDAMTGTMQVEIDIPNDEMQIKPGMRAEVSVRLESREAVLTLPVQCQLIEKDSPWILVVENDVVKKLPLKKGLSNREYFEVLNEEISDSSMVIVQGKSLVSSNQKVKPVHLK